MDENNGTLFMAGEDPVKVWRDLCLWKGDRDKDTRPVIPRYRTICPAHDCHRCTNPDCSCTDFIRRYWNHPQCD